MNESIPVKVDQSKTTTKLPNADPQADDEVVMTTIEAQPVHANPTKIEQQNNQQAMKKLENKLKRLVDLGDINGSKQTQIYLDVLSDVGKTNP